MRAEATDGSGGIRQPLQPFSLLTTQSDDALAKGRLAEPGGERACRHRPGDDGHRLPGILFAFPCESAIPTPVEQEQGIVYQNRTRQGVARAAGKETPMVPEIVYTSCPKELRNSYRFTILASYHPSNAKCLVPRTLLQWSHAYPRKTFAPFVFARRASAASNRPIQCVVTRLSVFPVVIPLAAEFCCPSDDILMPIGRISNGH